MELSIVSQLETVTRYKFELVFIARVIRSHKVRRNWFGFKLNCCVLLLLLQVSTLLGMNLLFQDEDETNAVVWFNEIKKAIKRLPYASKGPIPLSNHAHFYL